MNASDLVPLPVCKSGSWPGEIRAGPIRRSAAMNAGASSANSAQPPIDRHARIYRHEATFFLESLGGHAVKLDGASATGVVPLDRRHVISLLGDVEFVYSTSSSAGQRTPPLAGAPVPIAPPPAPPKAPPVADAALQTMHDPGGFGALPELRRAPSSSPSGTPLGPDGKPITAPRPKQMPSPDTAPCTSQRVPVLEKRAPAPAPLLSTPRRRTRAGRAAASVNESGERTGLCAAETHPAVPGSSRSPKKGRQRFR